MQSNFDPHGKNKVEGEIRKLVLKAMDYEKKANDSAKNRDQPEALRFYTSAIESYLKVVSLCPGNSIYYDALFNLYEDRAICYFNRNMLKKAASAFLEAFETLIKTYELKKIFNEVFYRRMIKIFINLTDTYIALSNTELAKEAFNYSVLAFKKIEELGGLTEKESLLLSQPNLSEAIYSFYEEQVSYPVFTSTELFEVQQRMLFQRHEEGKKDEEIEESLTTKISRNVLQDNSELDFLDKQLNDNNDLGRKLTQKKNLLNIEELMILKKLPEFFSQQLSAQESDNLNKLAMQYKNQGDSYFLQGKNYFKHAIESYNAAIEALNKIEKQSTETHEKIEFLNKCIEKLDKELAMPMQPVGLIHSVGLFSNNNNQSEMLATNVPEPSIAPMDM